MGNVRGLSDVLKGGVLLEKCWCCDNTLNRVTLWIYEQIYPEWSYGFNKDEPRIIFSIPNRRKLRGKSPIYEENISNYDFI